MKFTSISSLLSVIIAASLTITVSADRGAPVPTKILGKCDFEWDCDEDHQCMKGLICADRHKKELKMKGLDSRTATCGPNTKYPLYEVCFDPALIFGGGAFGDPHFQTFDGTQYSFHGECDLVMARSVLSGNSTSIDIHARTTMIDNWSLISNAAIKLGIDVLEIVNDNTYYLNGVKNVGFPLTMDGQHIVRHHDEMFTSNEETDAKPEVMAVYTIEIDTGVIKVSNYRGMIQIDVNAALVATEGMMGSQQMVGMIARDQQTILSDANSMGAEWQVRDNELMLFQEKRAPQYPQTCTLPSAVSGQRKLRQSPHELQKAQAACATVGESHRHFCIEDALLSGDVNMAHAYRFRA